MLILQRDGMIDPDTCRRLIDIYDRHIDLAQRRDHTGHPVLYCLLADIDSTARALVTNVVRSCRDRLLEGLGLSGSIYPETVILAGIGAGGHHLRHADNVRLDEHGHWVPNHVPQRDFSALIYLNGDFEGGEIVFDHQDIVIRPRPGLLVAFPSNEDYVHEVRPVRSGYRYSMPIWFTRQESFAMSEFIGREGLAGSLEC